jgi:hypothetical protein
MTEHVTSRTQSVAFTARDRALLSHFRYVRALTTDQIRLLVGPESLTSDKVIQRRLKKLHDHAYVRRLRGQNLLRFNSETGRYAGRQRLAYSLGSKGALLLDSLEPGMPESNWDRRSDVGQFFVEHSVLTSWPYVALRAGIKYFPNLKSLGWGQGDHLKHVFQTDSQYKTLLPSKAPDRGNADTVSHTVFPDAVFRLMVSDRNTVLTCFLEADRSTETNRRFVDKLIAYSLFRRFGFQRELYKTSDFLIVTVTLSPARRDNLRLAAYDVLARLEQPDRVPTFRFACKDDFHEHTKNFFGKIWYAPAPDRESQQFTKRYSFFD